MRGGAFFFSNAEWPSDFMSPDPQTQPQPEAALPTLFETLAARVPSLQAPAYTRVGQRQYLRRARSLYAASLVKTGLSRANRRKLAREVSFA